VKGASLVKTASYQPGVFIRSCVASPRLVASTTARNGLSCPGTRPGWSSALHRENSMEGMLGLVPAGTSSCTTPRIGGKVTIVPAGTSSCFIPMSAGGATLVPAWHA
jgi:hypothetical protein